jgi:hypothetical protein
MGRKKKKYLYHATVHALVSSIRKGGLGNTTRTMWEDSVPGVVYFCEDREEAIDFINCSEKAWDEFGVDGEMKLALFRIDPAGLDPEKLFPDKNILDEPEGFFEYHGVIDPQFLRKIKVK